MIKQNSLDFLTADQSIKQSKDYAIIADILTEMVKSGAISLGTGYCISISDMIYNALKHRGISSKMVECSLTLTYSDNSTLFIGFDNIKNPGEIDTHVVVVTETTPPMIIDASISNRLPNNTQLILDSCNRYPNNNSIFADLNFKDFNIKATYREKQSQRIPSLHHRSFLDRIETDNRIFKSLKILKILLAVALAITTLNGLRGLYDFYNIYVSENRLGPTSTQNLQDRIENIEKLLIKKVER